MNKIKNFAIYNPGNSGIQNDQEFKASFVARKKLFENLRIRLAEIGPTGLAKHFLIIGQRGMGKTSLLRRVSIAVNEDAKLNSHLLPLTFREEQYNVHNLNIFWRNCIDALGDCFDRQGQQKKADKLDEESMLLPKAKKDPEGREALELFKRWMKEEGKRPLLFLDNMDLIFDGLKKEQWSLRKVLQEPGGIVVFGASSVYMEATEDVEAAFYDFFQVSVLGKLKREELQDCIKNLASNRGEQGDPVLKTLKSDPERIHILYDLTGGNPRTLTLLYLVLEMSAEKNADVFKDLERLLDQVTALYKARVEELAPQTRIVLDALALNWNPATAKEVAEASQLDTSTTSAQLDRLLKEGIVEKTSLSKRTARTGFQLSERFFNIWYLMRNGQRRERTRLRWLTEFLRSFYSSKELKEKYEYLRNQTKPECSPEYKAALGFAVEDMDLELQNKNILYRDIKPETAEEWFQKGMRHLRKEENEEAGKAFLKVKVIDPKDAYLWKMLGYLYADFLNQFKEAENAYRKAIQLEPKDASSWNGLGNLYALQLDNDEEAEKAFREAILLDSEYAYPWNGLGNLHADQLGKYEDAITAYKMAIQLDEGYPTPWYNMGFLYTLRLNNLEEALSLFEQCMNLKQGQQDLFFEFVPGIIIAIRFLRPNVKGMPTDEEFQAVVENVSNEDANLLRAIRDLSIGNFGDSSSALALAMDPEETEYFDPEDILLILYLRFIKERGYGDKLLDWFAESGMKDRQWPLYAAFDAFMYGADRLRDVNPEVRNSAQSIYDKLTPSESQSAMDR